MPDRKHLVGQRKQRHQHRPDDGACAAYVRVIGLVRPVIITTVASAIWQPVRPTASLTLATLAPIIKASAEQVGVALAIVFLLNAVALLATYITAATLGDAINYASEFKYLHILSFGNRWFSASFSISPISFNTY